MPRPVRCLLASLTDGQTLVNERPRPRQEGASRTAAEERTPVTRAVGPGHWRPCLWRGQCGSAGGNRRVVNNERGLQRAVFGAGELERYLPGEAVQRATVLLVAGGAVEVGERRQRGAVVGDGQLVELRGGSRFGSPVAL